MITWPTNNKNLAHIICGYIPSARLSEFFAEVELHARVAVAVAIWTDVGTADLKSLVLYWALNRDPSVLGIRTQCIGDSDPVYWGFGPRDFVVHRGTLSNIYFR